MQNYNKKILKANLLSIKKIIVSMSGPIVNLIFVILFTIMGKGDIAKWETLIYANILILIFNMLPIYPLDGGRIVKNITYLFFGKITALKVTNIISIITTSVLTVFSVIISIIYKNITYILVLIYIWILTIKEHKIYKMKIKMYKILKNNIAINRD